MKYAYRKMCFLRKTESGEVTSQNFVFTASASSCDLTKMQILGLHPDLLTWKPGVRPRSLWFWSMLAFENHRTKKYYCCVKSRRERTYKNMRRLLHSACFSTIFQFLILFKDTYTEHSSRIMVCVVYVEKTTGTPFSRALSEKWLHLTSEDP